MSLRAQITTLLIALSVILVATTYAVESLIVMPAFVRLERHGADRNIDQCVNALERELDGLSNIANDWASWDDSYQYVQDHNETFAKVNLVDQAFSSTHINLICILDQDRRIVWGESRDMKTLELINVPDLFQIIEGKASSITQHQSTDDFNQGLLLTSRGPILLAARPIITTKREGPIMGSVIMGRFLNETESKNLAERTQTELDIWQVDDQYMPESARRCMEFCSKSGEKFIEVVDGKKIHAYTIMKDIFDQPAILLRVGLKREITAQGSISTIMAMGCSIVGGVLTLFAMWAVLQWRIVEPLQRMAAHAIRVGKDDNLKARLQFNRCDEIGTLANEFDDMFERLAESRKKVLNTAHRAGMAEIASEVLHNVGNAVNSANCSVEMLNERLANSKIGGLERATKLLREQAPHAAEFFGKDPNGAKLIDYLSNLNETLLRERVENQAEVKRMRDTIRHICDAIATQQIFAGRSNFLQEVNLEVLIEEILLMNEALIRSSEVQVVVDLPPLPELQLNKSKMTQILVNLVRNAIQSMQSQPADARRMTIAAKCVEEDGIEIAVTDTGTGFGEEVRTMLFTHGFTTKIEGNGFGLHFCANAIREAGGHITAQSSGVGQGASFRIRLPQVMGKVNAVAPATSA